MLGRYLYRGIATIELRITDYKGKNHVMRIYKVIYLPTADKHIISVSQWSIDKQDDDGLHPSNGSKSSTGAMKNARNGYPISQII